MENNRELNRPAPAKGSYIYAFFVLIFILIFMKNRTREVVNVKFKTCY